MSMPVIAFFNNKGGVGKTSLVYHLAWMYADMGKRVVAADIDPQANLTAAFIDEDRLEELWSEDNHLRTVFGCVEPFIEGIGDVADPHLEMVEQNLALLVGDLRLSGFEDQLSEVWPKCMDRDPRAFRITSAFWRIVQKAAAIHEADMIFIDVGPNLGAINRAALVATDHVVVPLSPDLFSTIGVHNLGPTLRRWREGWKERLEKNPVPDLLLPAGEMLPLGYVVLQHSQRMDRPAKAYDRWIARIQKAYREDVLGEQDSPPVLIQNDPNCLAMLKHYRSLMPMAQEAHKPMFHLKPADGAIGSHYQAAQSARGDFQQLAQKIAKRAGVPLSSPSLAF
ncbi:MAG: AAA family ATPase [Acidobacteriota bacterium]